MGAERHGDSDVNLQRLIDNWVWEVYLPRFHPAFPPGARQLVGSVVGSITHVQRSDHRHRARAAIVIEGSSTRAVVVGNRPINDPEVNFALLCALACWLLCARGFEATPRRVYEFAAALAIPAAAVELHTSKGHGASWFAEEFGMTLAIARMRLHRVFGI